MKADSIEQTVTKILTKISHANTLSELNNLETLFLGRHGQLREWTKQLSNLKDISEKQHFGKLLNEFKRRVEQSLAAKRESLLEEKNSKFLDVTLPGKKSALGSLHIVTKAINEIVQIFAKIGFYRLSYNEVEWEYFAFDALNMPPDHPARDDFESFFIKGEASVKYGRMVLSPHTSSGQVREMLRRGKPPIRMINIAACYRRNYDSTHTPLFHQFEGLCVDKGINIKHLKGTISHFAKEFYGYDAKIRLRPYNFRFTEPSFEVDISCQVCKGKGVLAGEKCRVCKSGWLELGGAGMVHPNVLAAGGIASSQYSGWAFGFGIERVYMMKPGLNLTDIRKLYSAELL